MKRIGIFFFYDEKGIVDDYVDCFLNEMNKFLDKLVIVCNGLLTPFSRKKLKKFTSDLIVRENKGFDVWAYKEAIEYVSWDQLYQFEELILFNFTNFGPIFPFEEMFNEMEKKELDFWGITKFHSRKNKGYLDKYVSYDYLPEHIQSHFIAIRSRMFKSYEFKSYWENMRPVNSYAEAVGYHEAIFTQKFSDYGFLWDVYVNTDNLKASCEYPLMWQPLELIKNQRCPIVKRRSFFYIPYYGYLHNGVGEASLELYNYIKNETDYNTDLIWDNILRTSNMLDIKRSLQLNYILSDIMHKEIAYNSLEKVVLLVSIKEKNCMRKYVSYLKNAMQMGIYIFGLFENEKVYSEIEELFEKNNVVLNDHYIVKKEESYYYMLTEIMIQLSSKYEFLCSLNFDIEKTHQIEGIEESSVYLNCENLFKSKGFINNIIETFKNNKKLGLLVPTTPIQSDYSKYISREWVDSIECVENLANKFDVPFDRKKPLIAPYKGMFWVRCNALKTLVDYMNNVSNTDALFRDNHSIFPVLFTCLPIFIQFQKYYIATVYSESYAAIELTNLRFYLEEMKLNTSPYSDRKNLIDFKNILLNNKNIFK